MNKNLKRNTSNYKQKERKKENYIKEREQLKRKQRKK